MNSAEPVTTPDLEEELDDPYIHTVSTEEFVETVEQANQEENQRSDHHPYSAEAEAPLD